MTEKEVEVYLREQVKVLGGKAYKFESPGNAGVPDRVVILPGGRIAFVELKAPGRKSTALQDTQQRRMRDLGCDVFVLDGKDEVDVFIRLYAREVRR